jgi:Protein of unknown function (DUF2384)
MAECSDAAFLEAEVRKVLGDGALEWMHRPSRLFDNMPPVELALSSPEGARVVLLQLERSAVPVAAAMKQRRRAES